MTTDHKKIPRSDGKTFVPTSTPQKSPIFRAPLSFSVSIAIHAAAAVYIFTVPNPLGLVADPTNAISVNEAPTIVVEAMRETPQEPTAESQPASEAAEEIETEQEPEPEAAEPDETPPETTKEELPNEKATADENKSAEADQKTKRSELVDVPAPLKSAPDPDIKLKTEHTKEDGADQTKQDRPPEKRIETMSPKLESVKKPDIRKPPPETKRKPKQKTSKKIPQKKSRASESQAKKAKKGSAGRVSASRGDFLSYASRVRARVASKKPRNQGQRGRVSISFRVTKSGGIAAARITRRSGSAALDRASLAAVRRAAPFPKPPAGMPARLRSFSLSFSFR